MSNIQRSESGAHTHPALSSLAQGEDSGERLPVEYLPAIGATPCSAVRVTLVGSMIHASISSMYSSVAASVNFWGSHLSPVTDVA